MSTDNSNLINFVTLKWGDCTSKKISDTKHNQNSLSKIFALWQIQISVWFLGKQYIKQNYLAWSSDILRRFMLSLESPHAKLPDPVGPTTPPFFWNAILSPTCQGHLTPREIAMSKGGQSGGGETGRTAWRGELVIFRRDAEIGGTGRTSVNCAEYPRQIHRERRESERWNLLGWGWGSEED